MGSTGGINRPEYWEIDRTATFATGSPAVEVIIGDWNDYGGGGDISQWMHQDVFDKIKSGNYSVKKLFWQNDIPIKVFDPEEREIDLFTDKVAEYVSCSTCKWFEKAPHYVRCIHVQPCVSEVYERGAEEVHLKGLRWQHEKV